MAQHYFEQGYNCAQAVALAFQDIFANLSKDEVAALTSGFGGGMGRLREVCGAFSACVLVTGQISPAVNPKNTAERTANYALVQDLAEKFKQVNGGSIVCRELLGLGRTKESPVPSQRDAQYYHKRSCSKTVYNAALILAQTIDSNQVQ